MTSATTCPPLADRITKSLLGYGVIAGPVYVVAVAAQEATRDGFDPTRHAASQLANGDFGWVQTATFLITGDGESKGLEKVSAHVQLGGYIDDKGTVHVDVSVHSQ